jgi:uncharacterized phiE125 gp8 family phage protein
MPWAPDYVTAAELKTYIRVDDTVDDLVIGTAITAASRIVDRHTNRQFGLVDPAVAQLYTARYDKRRCQWVVDVDDFQTTVGLTVQIDGSIVTTFVKEPQNVIVQGRPWTRIAFTPESEVTPTGKVDEVGVIAKWGWTAVPETIKQATLLQASRLFVRRGAPFGVAGSPEQGTELRLLARVDPDVAVTLGPYIRWWSVA